MQSRGSPSAESMYRSLKQQYDDLLEKNQNDIVKIKIREKQLNDRIEQYKKENKRLLEENEALKAASTQGPSIKSIQDELTPQNKVTLQKLTQNQKQQINTLRLKLQEKQAEVHQLGKKTSLRQAKLKECENILQKSQKQNSYLRVELNKYLSKEQQQKQMDKNQRLDVKRAEQHMKILQFQKATLESGVAELKSELASEKQKNQERQLNLTSFEDQLRELRKKLAILTKQKESPCEQCGRLQQQIELQQEMLKSVRMMLRFKEMEIEKMNSV